MAKVTMSWAVSAGGSAAMLGMSLDDVRFQVSTTYVGDGLGSLVFACVDLLRGSRSANALLPDEPSGTWFFFGGADEEVGLQIVQFPDVWGEVRWGRGRCLWFGRVGVREVAEQVRRVAESALQQYGSIDAYNEAWNGIKFPLEDLNELSHRLGY